MKTFLLRQLPRLRNGRIADERLKYLLCSKCLSSVTQRWDGLEWRIECSSDKCTNGKVGHGELEMISSASEDARKGLLELAQRDENPLQPLDPNTKKPSAMFPD